jgi:prepilin peptidase CpaA
MTHPFLPWILPVVVSLLAAAIDFRTGRIPNWLTFPAIVAGLAEGSAMHGLAGFTHALLGLLLCGAVPWLLHRLSGGQAIGGGDVKLFAALGAFGGTTIGLEIEFSSFAVLAVIALVQLAFRGQLLTVLGNVVRILVRPFRRSAAQAPLSPASMTEVRMGPAIAVAVLAVALTEWLPWLA